MPAWAVAVSWIARLRRRRQASSSADLQGEVAA